MTTDPLLIVGGAGLLAYSGNRLVDFAAALAERARLAPAVIGLTVVAAGTSAPELLVSVVASAQGSPAIAIGNVVGSNVANLGLILGVAALIAPLPVARGVLRFEYPFLVLASWISILLCRDGLLDRLEAAFFLASMLAFIGYSVWVARTAVGPAESEHIAEEMVPHRARVLGQRPVWVLAIGLCAALGGLLLGAHGLVSGAESMAHALGITERVIGLTVVAIGTSLPELAVTLAAAVKKQQEMAMATVVGSNIFNLLMILGAAGLVQPLVVDARMVALDLWVMMALTALLFPLVVRVEMTHHGEGGSLLSIYPGALSRPRGAILLLAYAGYITWLAMHAA